MDFWRTVAVLFRRWYITVPAFFATLGLAAAAYSAVPLQYESGSTLLLTTPLTGATESTAPDHTDAVTNPLMNFDRSLALAASLIIQELRSSEGAEALGVVPGGTTGFEVNNGSSNPELLESGPFIFIRGTGSSPEAAQDVTTRVATRAAAILSSRQEQLNAPPSTHIELQVVVAPKPGQPLLGSPLRAAAGAAGLAALASLVAVYGFESLMIHRRRRRAARQRETDEEGSATATAPESSGARPAGLLEPDDSLHLVHANGTSEER